MNRKATPILLAAVVLMSALAFYLDRPRREAAAPQRTASGKTVLSIRQEDVTQIRVKRDYWNSYTLAKSADGTWRLVEPSAEPASEAAVRKLLNALESLPATSVIDLPHDSDRRREYGLWTPSVEVAVSVPQGEQILIVGTPTADGKGIYCARMGQDAVYVTTAESLQVLSQELAAYRQEH